MKRFVVATAVLVLSGLGGAMPVQAHAHAHADHQEIAYYADQFADHFGVPRELVRAIITQESGWNPNAVSSKGAIGLMQLMPATAARYQVENPLDAIDNLRGGVSYLADLSRQFDGDLRLVVAAFYVGEHPIQRRLLQYSNRDVYAYVESVRRLYSREVAQAHNKQFVIAHGGPLETP